MSSDPMSTFGGLLRGCISDSDPRRERRDAIEGAAVMLLGIGCSIATSYVLAALGFFV